MNKIRCKIHNVFASKNGCKLCQKEITDMVKASKSLNRSDSSFMVRIYQGESILAGFNDSLVDAPESKRAALKPLLDRISYAADIINEVNKIIEHRMEEVLTKEQYDNLIVTSIRIMEVASGKVKNCQTCITAIEKEKEIKKMIKEEWVPK